MRKVTDLKVGERAIVKSFLEPELSLKLLEMGCLPGTEVFVNFISPLGDPIGLKLPSYTLSMRISEAACIVVE